MNNDMTDSAFMWYLAEWIKDKPFIMWLISLMFLDILAGTFVSISKKRLSSSASWRGMSKKALTLIIVGTAFVIERLINHEFPLGKASAILYCATEALSILENAAAAGVPLPRGLVQVLLKLQQDSSQKSPAVHVESKVTVTQPTGLSEPESRPTTVHTSHEVKPPDNR
jgi:toxin secretion/phage lysis holin